MTSVQEAWECVDIAEQRRQSHWVYAGLPHLSNTVPHRFTSISHPPPRALALVYFRDLHIFTLGPLYLLIILPGTLLSQIHMAATTCHSGLSSQTLKKTTFFLGIPGGAGFSPTKRFHFFQSLCHFLKNSCSHIGQFLYSWSSYSQTSYDVRDINVNSLSCQISQGSKGIRMTGSQYYFFHFSHSLWPDAWQGST